MELKVIKKPSFEFQTYKLETQIFHLFMTNTEWELVFQGFNASINFKKSNL